MRQQTIIILSLFLCIFRPASSVLLSLLPPLSPFPLRGTASFHSLSPALAFPSVQRPASSALRSPFLPLTHSPLPQDTSIFISAPPLEFNATFRLSSNPIIIDVREFFEYRRKRLPGAINVPYYGNLKAVADTLNKKHSLFIYCTSGVRSKWAAKIFCDNGFTNVYSLDGGINAWRKEGYPLEKSRKRK